MSEPMIGCSTPQETCEHKNLPVSFDEEAAKGLSADEVQRRWPRFWGNCPDCGVQIIGYASSMHYYMGDW